VVILEALKSGAISDSDGHSEIVIIVGRYTHTCYEVLLAVSVPMTNHAKAKQGRVFPGNADNHICMVYWLESLLCRFK
jgi:hypothetical protein